VGVELNLSTYVVIIYVGFGGRRKDDTRTAGNKKCWKTG